MENLPHLTSKAFYIHAHYCILDVSLNFHLRLLIIEAGHRALPRNFFPTMYNVRDLNLTLVKVVRWLFLSHFWTFKSKHHILSFHSSVEMDSSLKSNHYCQVKLVRISYAHVKNWICFSFFPQSFRSKQTSSWDLTSIEANLSESERGREIRDNGRPFLSNCKWILFNEIKTIWWKRL